MMDPDMIRYHIVGAIEACAFIVVVISIAGFWIGTP